MQESQNIVVFDCRSHTDKTILLLHINGFFVPIAEQAVMILAAEEDRVSHKSATEAGEKGKAGGGKVLKEVEKGEKQKKSMISDKTVEEDELWARSLQSVDSMKSLAGIPSISEADETLEGQDAREEVQELRASSLEPQHSTPQQGHCDQI